MTRSAAHRQWPTANQSCLAPIGSDGAIHGPPRWGEEGRIPNSGIWVPCKGTTRIAVGLNPRESGPQKDLPGPVGVAQSEAAKRGRTDV